MFGGNSISSYLIQKGKTLLFTRDQNLNPTQTSPFGDHNPKLFKQY